MTKEDRRRQKLLKEWDSIIGKMTKEDLEIAVKQVQFMSVPDGGKELINLENLLFTFTSQPIEGISNNFKSYDAQVIETYLKYNGLRDYGCWQTKAIIDLRTSFIIGEGMSVSAVRPSTGKWLDKFIEKNKLNGMFLFRAVKGSEMTGKILFKIKEKEKDDEKFAGVVRIPYGNITNELNEGIKTGENFEVILKDKYDKEEILKIQVTQKGEMEPKTLISDDKKFVYIITGGDDTAVNSTNTKVGMCLTEIENYDRVLKDLRRMNYVVNRITPDFKCANKQEATTTAGMIKKTNWKMGYTRVGTADFNYKTPATSAHQNDETELQANAKAISTITGVPVHWLGHTELMSNRSTAQTLYEMIDAATKQERVVIQEGIRELMIKAMEFEIDLGIGSLTKVDYDFEVRLPLISFHQFKDNIQALSTALADKVISKDDYMNFIPGIDPIKTKKALEAEEKEAMEKFNETMMNNKGQLGDELQGNLQNDNEDQNSPINNKQEK